MIHRLTSILLIATLLARPLSADLFTPTVGSAVLTSGNTSGALSLSQGAFRYARPRGWHVKIFLISLAMQVTGIGSFGMGGLWPQSPESVLPLIKDPALLFRQGIESAEDKRGIKLSDDPGILSKRISPLLGNDEYQRLQIALLGNLLSELSTESTDSTLYRSGTLSLFNRYFRLNWESPWGPARAQIRLRLHDRKPLVRFEFELQIAGQWVRVGFVRMGCDDIRDAFHAFPHVDASTDDRYSWLAHIPLQNPTESATESANHFYMELQDLETKIKEIPLHFFRHVTPEPVIEEKKPAPDLSLAQVRAMDEFSDLPFNAQRIQQFKQGLAKILSLRKESLGISEAQLRKSLREAPWAITELGRYLNRRLPAGKAEEVLALVATVRQGALADATKPAVKGREPSVYFYPNSFNGPAAISDFRRALNEFQRLVPEGSRLVIILNDHSWQASADVGSMRLKGAEYDMPVYQHYLHEAYKRDLKRLDDEAKQYAILSPAARLVAMRDHLRTLEKNSTDEMFMASEIELVRRSVKYVYPRFTFRTWLSSIRFLIEATAMLNKQTSPYHIGANRQLTLDQVRQEHEIERGLIADIEDQLAPYLSKGTSILIWSSMRHVSLKAFKGALKPIPLIPPEGTGMAAPSESYKYAVADLAEDVDISREMTVLFMAAKALEEQLMIGSDAEIQQRLDRILKMFSVEELQTLFESWDTYRPPAEEAALLISHLIVNLLTPLMNPSETLPDFKAQLRDRFSREVEWRSELWTMIATGNSSESFEALGRRLLTVLFNGSTLIREPLFGDAERPWFRAIGAEAA